eukprot:6213024-Pleurochrysis_carterae.AAC.10
MSAVKSMLHTKVAFGQFWCSDTQNSLQSRKKAAQQQALIHGTRNFVKCTLPPHSVPRNRFNALPPPMIVLLRGAESHSLPAALLSYNSLLLKTTTTSIVDKVYCIAGMTNHVRQYQYRNIKSDEIGRGGVGGLVTSRELKFKQQETLDCE